MPVKNDLKIEGNQVFWFNGVKWLVKETLKNNKEAVKKLEELNESRI